MYSWHNPSHEETQEEFRRQAKGPIALQVWETLPQCSRSAGALRETEGSIAMCFIGGPIYPHEELRAGMMGAGRCSICRAPSFADCDCCEAEICADCMVRCAGCERPDGPALCLSCAIRRGYAEINSKQYCEDCAAEFEPEIEETRR